MDRQRHNEASLARTGRFGCAEDPPVAAYLGPTKLLMRSCHLCLGPRATKNGVPRENWLRIVAASKVLSHIVRGRARIRTRTLVSRSASFIKRLGTPLALSFLCDLPFLRGDPQDRFASLVRWMLCGAQWNKSVTDPTRAGGNLQRLRDL